MPNATKIALGVLLLLLIALPRWVNPYVLQILILTITYAMLGLAFAFTLRVGLPRFDIAAWWAVGAYTTAVLMKKAGMSFWPTILIGGIIAVLLGWLVFKIAIPRGMIVFLMFGMVTAMAMQQVFGSISYFGGWGGTGLVPRPTIGSFKFIRKPELYYLGLFLLMLNIVVYYLLYNSKIGRAWNAIGSSLKLASSVGVDVVKYRMANVLIGNFFLAMAGSYYIAYSLTAVPSTFSFHNSIYVMMYVVVGGLAHSLSGPIIGSLIITFIPEYLRMAKEYEPIITGVATILIIIFMPMGILGLIDQRVKPWLAWRKRSARLSGGVNK
jgi:branched-chain amino acid transport system permease protein